jgi:hypothetical protein
VSRKRGRSHRRSHRSRKLRSQAARKAWRTRTRNEGIRQVVNTAISKAPPIAVVKTIKDITIGTLKIVKPDAYRKHKLLKKIDRAL